MEPKIDQLIKDKKFAELMKIIDDLSKDTVPIQESKPAITHIASRMGDVTAAQCT